MSELQVSNSRETAILGHESRAARNKKLICWREPAAIYPTDLEPFPIPEPREREMPARVIPEKTGRSPQKYSTKYKELKEEYI
jgi:hypothetical protein